MIRTKRQTDGFVQVTFALPDAGQSVSVVGDLNDWDPTALPMKKRSNGTRSVAVKVPAGTAIRFRYVADDGEYFDDPDGHLEPNGLGGTHTVVTV